MTELEEKIREALRRQAHRVDEPLPQRERPSAIGRIVGVLVAVGFVAIALVAANWMGRAPSQPGAASSSPTSPTPSTQTSPESQSCSPAPFAVTWLPWVAPGSLVPPPPPEVTMEGESAVSAWFEDADERWNGAYVALKVSSKQPFGASLDEFPTATVRGHEARLVWVGDPGVGEVALVWSEVAGDCAWLTLSLSTKGYSQQEAESTIREVAASLK